MSSLVWFRNDLRVHDNASLMQACQDDTVVAIYCIDPAAFKKGPFGFKKMERYRAKFLLETLEILQKNLAKLHITLLVYHKPAQEIIPEVIQKYKLQKVYLQREWTRDEHVELEQVKQRVPASISLIESFDQFLCHPEDIPYEGISQIPQVFTPFRKKCELHCPIRPSIPVPEKKAPSNLLGYQTQVPTLEDLGFEAFEIHPHTAFPFKGGEDAAMERIREYFWATKKIAYYKKTRNGLLGTNYSSKLSAWLANGSLSARQVFWELKKFEETVIKNEDTYWLLFELLWRDYFKYISMKYGNKIFLLGGILNKTYVWEYSEKAKNSWLHGYTEEPFVNANMKELALTGWMSNRGRQNVASYWAKELRQDWRIGAAYFEAMLIDYDVHSNWGNWMYNSGVGNDPRDRKFNIKRQAEQYDGDGKFQRLWLQDTLF